VDIWNAGDQRLKAGLDYLAPYSDPSTPWPHKTIRENDRMNMFPILLMADLKYPEGNYLEMVEKLPLDQRQIRRENLAFPSSGRSAQPTTKIGNLFLSHL